MNNSKEERRRSILRKPAEESVDLYPGLCVCDDRVSGSITAGQTRLPLWAFVGTVVNEGWEHVVSEEEGWPYMEEAYSWTQQKTSDFLYHLMQPRGEYGRLVLLLAEMNRVSEENDESWVLNADRRRQMREQLQRCLDALQE